MPQCYVWCDTHMLQHLMHKTSYMTLVFNFFPNQLKEKIHLSGVFQLTLTNGPQALS